MARPVQRWTPGARRGQAASSGPDLLAEVLVLAALNEDPAAIGVRELVDDRPLRDRTPYEAVVETTERQLGGRAAAGSGRARRRPRPARRPRERRGGRGVRSARCAAAGTAARADAPARRARSPRSCAGCASTGRSLIRGDPALARRIDLALDVLAEEARALELKGAGDHFGGPIVVETPDYRGLDSDAVGFSQDTEWMPRVVLMAKSTYVWLEQLAARHGRAIPTLADVPDEELDRLAELGVTGLWLIGLWQRSARVRGDQAPARRPRRGRVGLRDRRVPDRRRPRRRGRLRGAARARVGARHPPRRGHGPEPHGHRLALGRRAPGAVHRGPEPPFPAYTLQRPGPVAATRGSRSRSRTTTGTARTRRWSSGAATAESGEQRFIYHGNDGTSYPWNDTAQLDYLRADVREAVIQTILDVARRSPIIRFDAAMVLARRHIRRLWYPEPGAGGAIPSRAEHALSTAEFNRRMPAEFWREVVDRVAAEAPGTLLLAEAFWLLEGYFVRTLGMHRVYNSAFMHMLRDEDNAGYRKVMRDTLEFDPGVLGRFVNFLTNPDERPAAEQLGTGDKAFSAATLLATLPGLPMLGHGQVEGWRERYGHGVPARPLGRADRRDARRPLRVRDRAAPAAPGRLLRHGSVPPVRRDRRRRARRRERLRLLERRRRRPQPRPRAPPLRRDDRPDRPLGRGRGARQPRRAHADERSPRRGPRAPRARRPPRRSGSVDPRSGWELERTAGELRREGLRITLGPYEARVLWIDQPREPSPVPATPPTTTGDADEPRGGSTRPAKPAAATRGAAERRPTDQAEAPDRGARGRDPAQDQARDGRCRAEPGSTSMPRPDWVQPVTLEGSIVRLEPLSLDHLDGLAEVAFEPEPLALDARPADGHRDALRAWLDAALANAATGTELPFATVDRRRGRPIGSTRFMSIVPEHRRLEIGWTWVGLDWQRRGANQEAKLLQLTHAFETLGANRVEFKTDSLNEKANPALLAIGATFEGTFRNHMIMPGDRLRHSNYYSVAVEDWPAAKARLLPGERSLGDAAITAALTLCHHRRAIDLPGRRPANHEGDARDRPAGQDPHQRRRACIVAVLVVPQINVPGGRQPAEVRGQLVARRRRRADPGADQQLREADPQGPVVPDHAPVDGPVRARPERAAAAARGVPRGRSSTSTSRSAASRRASPRTRSSARCSARS